MDGFSADQPGIVGLAGFARERAGDVRGAVRALRGLPAASDDIFGDTGVTGADRDFLVAWLDELDIIAGGLDEVRQKFQETADGYQTHEVTWSHNFQNLAT